MVAIETLPPCIGRLVNLSQWYGSGLVSVFGMDFHSFSSYTLLGKFF